MKKVCIISLGILTAIHCGCGSKELIPEFYGMYALNGKQLVPIKDSDSPVDLVKECSFVFFDKATMGANGISLIKIDYMPQKQTPALDEYDSLLNNIESNMAMMEEQMSGIPSRGWNIPCKVQPVKSQAEMVRIVPETPLDAGYYQLGTYGRFTVDKKHLVNTHKTAMSTAAKNHVWEDVLVNAQAVLLFQEDDAEASALKSDAPGQIAKEIVNTHKTNMTTAAKSGAWEEALVNAQAVLMFQKDDADANVMIREVPCQKAAVIARDSMKNGDYEETRKAASEAMAVESLKEEMTDLLASIPRTTLKLEDDDCRFLSFSDEKCLRIVNNSGGCLEYNYDTLEVVEKINYPKCEQIATNCSCTAMLGSSSQKSLIVNFLDRNESLKLCSFGILTSSKIVCFGLSPSAQYASAFGKWTSANLSNFGVSIPDSDFASTGFIPEGGKLFSGIVIWDLAKKKTMHFIPTGASAVVALTFLSDEEFVSFEDDSTITTLKVTDATRVRQARISPQINIQGTWPCSAGPNQVLVISDNAIKSVNVQSGETKTVIPTQNSPFHSYSISKDGSLCAFNTGDKRVHVVDSLTGTEVLAFEESQSSSSGISDIAFHPDGNVLALAVPGEIAFWDMAKLGKKQSK